LPGHLEKSEIVLSLTRAGNMIRYVPTAILTFHKPQKWRILNDSKESITDVPSFLSR